MYQAQRSDADDGEDRPHAIDPQNVFSLVEDHALFDFVQDKVRVLVNLDEDAAITLLTRHADQVGCPAVCVGAAASIHMCGGCPCWWLGTDPHRACFAAAPGLSKPAVQVGCLMPHVRVCVFDKHHWCCIPGT